MAKNIKANAKNSLEWTVFAVSLAIVVYILVYLLYQAATQPGGSPILHVEYSKDPSPNEPYRYRIVVVNSGGETAQDVKLEAILLKQGEEIERSELEVEFATRGSTHEGWINFSNKAQFADSILCRVVSFKKP